MADREKLIELYDEANDYATNICRHNSCCDCPYQDSEIDCFEDAMFDRLIANGVTIQRWIPVTERLPESGKHVLVACEVHSYGGGVHGKYVCDGYYAAPKSMTGGCGDDFATEYDEEDDEYYLLEGWYEVIKNWDDYNSIVIPDFVTHWMPLPEAPKGE